MVDRLKMSTPIYDVRIYRFNQAGLSANAEAMTSPVHGLALESPERAERIRGRRSL
jgi:hypothetical protein